MILDSKKYHRPVIKRNQPDDSYKIQPLPKPTGDYPYHLNSKEVVQLPEDGFSFHMAGDTGGMRHPEGQQKVANEMARQIYEVDNQQDKPLFLYHLGDVVYHFGEAEHYDRQFFKPYAAYPSPVFAIAGNHDTDVNPAMPPYRSLDAFMKVFCDTVPQEIPFNHSSQRKSMVQPNVYWTLETPLANFIGLHSNAVKYGYIGPEQRKWFIEELKRAAAQKPGKCIILTIHHAPYTADVNHGASLDMITFLEGAFAESGVRPDIVFSGHVHNYQRFHKTYGDGKVVPFIVSGAGGFDELHDLVTVGDPDFSPDSPLFDGVKLQSYCIMKHGFLIINLKRNEEGVLLSGKYFSVEGEHPLLIEDFSYNFS